MNHLATWYIYTRVFTTMQVDGYSLEARKDDVSYVLAFKLSRFGRNAADILYSLRLMLDYGVAEYLNKHG